MIRALAFVLKAGLLIGVVAWLVAVAGQGRVEVLWHGYLIETKAGLAAIALLALVLLTWQAALLFRALVTLPRRFGRWRRDVSREDAYRALTQGLVAVAAGDVRQAEKMAARAKKALPEQPLTLLLEAQTSLMRGDAPAARRYFAALLEDPEGAFFGLRGLLNDSLATRDYRAARLYLERAEKLQPRRPWIIRSLFDICCRQRDWVAADRHLRRLQRCGGLSKEEAVSSRQALFLAQAMESLADATLSPEVQAREALRHGRAAWRMGPSFVPAAVFYADRLIAAGKLARARKVVRRAWQEIPHPQLMARWEKLVPALPRREEKTPGAAEEAAYAWIASLAALHPDHSSAQAALGRAALAARRWREARPLLEAVEDYQNLARLERAESGDSQAVRHWQAQARRRPVQAGQWVCGACGHGAAAWQPLCPSCDSFNRMNWAETSGSSIAHDPAVAETVAALSVTGIPILAPPQEDDSRSR